MKEKNCKIILSILIFWIVMETVAVFFRAFYGTEVTDEAFYLSTANQILQGRVPLINIWFIGSGAALCYSWLIGLYQLFVPDMEGLFLFSRLIFQIMRLGILIYGFIVIKKRSSELKAILVIGMLIPFYTLIGNFSYNSVPIYLVLLVGFLLVDEFSCIYKYKIRSLVAGILMALAVYSHPCEIVNVLVAGGAISLFSYQKLKNLRMYIYGGIGVSIAIIVWTLNRCGGLNECIDGIRLMIKYCTTVYGPKRGIRSYIKDAISYMQPELLYLFVFLLTAFSGATIYILVKKRKSKVSIYRCCMVISVALWVLLMIMRNANDAGFLFYTKFGTIAMLASVAVCIIARKDYENLIYFVCLSLPSIVFCFTNGLLAGEGIVSRMYVMIPCIVPFMLTLVRELQFDGVAIKQIYIYEFVLPLIVSAVLLRFDFCYVYRDGAISSLTTSIGSGIYKGLHTTEQTADSLLILQEIVKENLNQKEKIIVMDCTPSVYLMTNSVSVAPITWDITRFNNGRDDSEKVLGFFAYMGDIPDKILYVANPYKPKLSIDDSDFLFNNFVNENYHLIKKEKINDIYDIRIYDINEDIN